MINQKKEQIMKKVRKIKKSRPPYCIKGRVVNRMMKISFSHKIGNASFETIEIRTKVSL